jgi:hypothetical protein
MITFHARQKMPYLNLLFVGRPRSSSRVTGPHPSLTSHRSVPQPGPPVPPAHTPSLRSQKP